MNLLEQNRVTLRRDTDRCDRCGAMGHALLEKGEGNFILCRHHYNLHEAELIAQAWAVSIHLDEDAEQRV